MEDTEIISQVRFVTEYPEMVVSDGKVTEAIRFTEDEMKGIFDDPDMTFESYHAGRAVMWGTCYHLKVHTGEIGGLPISIGNLDFENLNEMQGGDTDIFRWADKFWENIYRMNNSPKGFGITNAARGNREYGDGSSSSGSTNDSVIR